MMALETSSLTEAERDALAASLADVLTALPALRSKRDRKARAAIKAEIEQLRP